MVDTVQNESMGFLQGGGEMGGLIRNFDWGLTPLGAQLHGRNLYALRSAFVCILVSLLRSIGAKICVCYTTMLGHRLPQRGIRPFSDALREKYGQVFGMLSGRSLKPPARTQRASLLMTRC